MLPYCSLLLQSVLWLCLLSNEKYCNIVSSQNAQNNLYIFKSSFAVGFTDTRYYHEQNCCHHHLFIIVVIKAQKKKFLKVKNKLTTIVPINSSESQFGLYYAIQTTSKIGKNKMKQTKCSANRCQMTEHLAIKPLQWGLI